MMTILRIIIVFTILMKMVSGLQSSRSIMPLAMVATATSAASGTVPQRDRIIGALMSRLLPLYLYLQSLLVPGPGAAVRVELLL